MRTATISQKPFNPAHAALVPVALAKLIVEALVNAGEESLAATLADAAGHEYTDQQRELVNILRATIPGLSDGDLESDTEAPVSFGNDRGAYVACWKWVPFKPIEEGDEFIMPDPVADLGDAWQQGRWTGTVVDFRDDGKLVTVQDADGDSFDIELHRLAVCERA